MKLPWDTQIKEGKVQVDCDDFAPPQPGGAGSGVYPSALAMGYDNCPPLNIVMFVVGSRGELQYDAEEANLQATCSRTSLLLCS